MRPLSHRIRLFPWELASMPEYSSTLPTGTTLWRMWRCDPRPIEQQRVSRCARWFVGQYVPCDEPGMVGIKWFQVQLLEGPAPAVYTPPDWGNFARFAREGATHTFPMHNGAQR